MKIFGGVLLLFASFFAARGYGRFVREGVRQADGFYELFCGLASYINASGAPIQSYMDGVDIPALSAVGFFTEYDRTKCLYDAFLAVRRRLFLPKGISDTADSVLRSLGRGDISTEVHLLRCGAEELKKMIDEYRTESERKIRIVTVSLAAAAFGLFMILL